MGVILRPTRRESAGEAAVALGLFGKKSDHPLADLKTAQQLLDDIPKTDSLKALQELSEWIESIREHANDFKLDHQWAVLRMFDQAAQSHVRKLLHDYFPLQALSKFQENRLWTLLDAFYTQSELSHYDVFTRYREGAKGASTIKSDLPLVCARAISANTGRLKMSVARYSIVDPTLWKHVAAFYSYAEAQSVQTDAVTMYPGVNTSVAQEFAVLVTWFGSTAGTMIPLHAHITERLFSYLGKGLQISSSYNGIGIFAFDTAQPTPPMRATAEATIHPALRFIEAEGVRQQLDSLIKTLEKGIIPDSLNLYGAKLESELVRDIANSLMQSLTLPPPTRRNPRRQIKVNLKVANGFFKMLEQTDVGLNFGADESESWEVEDISATGFRSVIPLARAEGVKIGTLVGSRPESVSHWGAGVVRRLSRDAQNNLHIGVEVLSSRFVGVPLADRAKAGADAGMLGLYLNRPNDTSGEAWLLMKVETFAINRSLVMQLEDKEYLLLPLALIERGEDYDLARYRMMEQEVSEDE
ncbi:MAG: hypothetical protein C0406_08615 [Sideroxydans sp.]|nr:hypothetical protein [Sideroxydans sp.]